MSNEYNGLDFVGNQDVIGNVVKPEFEFNGSNTLESDNIILTDRATTSDLVFNSNKDINEDHSSNIDQNNDDDKDIYHFETTKKETPVVIQQKYGATTTTVPYSSAPTTPNTKFESIKSWTISTYKCSRQTLFEKLGKSSRTVDSELEAQIESLRETQRKYANILRLSRALTSHFYHVIQTQSALGECFNDLAHKSPELQEEFLYNSETQKSLTKNGETLIKALNFFVSSVNTLCNKTMEDTIETVKQYEMARVEFDAYRSDLEFYSSAPQTEVNLAKQRETEEAFTRQKQEFEKLRSDVQIKLKFLDENRVKVMHKQLLLFHNAISAYFSGNEKSLEATMKQFSINIKTPNSSAPSWVEQ